MNQNNQIEPTRAILVCSAFYSIAPAILRNKYVVSDKSWSQSRQIHNDWYDQRGPVHRMDAMLIVKPAEK